MSTYDKLIRVFWYSIAIAGLAHPETVSATIIGAFCFGVEFGQGKYAVTNKEGVR